MSGFVGRVLFHSNRLEVKKYKSNSNLYFGKCALGSAFFIVGYTDYQTTKGKFSFQPRPNDGPASTPATSKEEQEKAELIMQVLRLREEDIVKMAPDQQRTVRMLRDQFKNISK